MTDTTPPIPELTPEDVIEVMRLVHGFERLWPRDTAKACAVIVLRDRHGWTHTEAAQRVTLATAAFDRMRRLMGGHTNGRSREFNHLTAPNFGRGPSAHVVIIDEVRGIDAA